MLLPVPCAATAVIAGRENRFYGYFILILILIVNIIINILRCQTAETMCTLVGYQPVIPSVTFIN